MPRRRLVALALLAGLAAPAGALDPGRRLTQFVHDVWRAPQALPNDGVSAIVQSRDGYLWVGTVEGLARFDGVRSVVFDKGNTPAFVNNWVKALVEDRQGRLWVGTYGGGLVCHEAGRFRRYGPAEGLPQESVLALLQDRQGRVLVGTLGGGLLQLGPAGQGFERVAGTESLAEASVRALHEDRAGELWVGTEHGLYRLAQAGLTRVEGLADERVISLADDEQGLWIGTERAGLARLQDGRVTAILGPRQGLSHERIWSLHRDRAGSLWIGTDGGGLQRLRDGRLESLSTKNGLPCDYVWAFHEDREGSLWVATNGGGLNRLKDGRVVPLGTREGLPSDFTWASLRTRDGSLWVGTEDAGLARLQDGRVTRFGSREGLLGGQVRALLEARDGALWIGGSGLYRFQGGRLRAVDLPGSTRVRIRALAEDDAGRIWIAAASEGVKCLAGNRLEVQPLERLAVDASSVLVARDGTVWAGGPGGLHSTKAGLTRSFTTADGLPSLGVTSLAEDTDGSLWVGTRAGLARVQQGRVESLTRRQGLLEDTVVLVRPDDAGGIWLGSNHGLHRIGRAQALAAAAGRRATLDTLHLGLDDGLRSLEINSSGSSASRDRDGQLWFATRAGLARVDPARLEPNPLPAPVVIEEVLADERPLAGSGGWRLPPGTLRLEIHYTGLSLRSPSAVRFRRRLVGFDANWVEAGHKRVVDYTNLPHGRYRFQVTAANDDGLWNEQGAALDFEIAPRLFETLLFQLLAAAFFALAGPAFYLVRVRRLRGQKQELERLVAARTAELQAATERLAQLSREDPLTGVANRRRLDEALEEEWRRATRQREPLTLLLLDVDFFKDYNDRLGHVAGDICLQAVARAVADAHRRAGEVVARYGGEEFAVLLPGLSREAALAAGELLRRRVQELDLPHPGSGVARVVTVSVGVAWLNPESGRTPTELLVEADRALYRAKSGGRNRVES